MGRCFKVYHKGDIYHNLILLLFILYLFTRDLYLGFSYLSNFFSFVFSLDNSLSQKTW